MPRGQRLAHLVLAGDLRLGEADRFGGDRRGEYDHAVVVGENEVARVVPATSPHSIGTPAASTRMRPRASAHLMPRANVAKPMSISSSVSRA